jgi:hypothetical protein
MARATSFLEMALIMQALPDAVQAKCKQALEPYTIVFEDVATATDSYSDVTGATRASTMSFVADASDFPGPVPDQSRATVTLYNPGYEADDNILAAPGAHQIVLDSMSGTNYSYYLNIRNGLESSYLLDALHAGAVQAFDGLCATLSDMFRGQ